MEDNSHSSHSSSSTHGITSGGKETELDLDALTKESSVLLGDADADASSSTKTMKDDAAETVPSSSSSMDAEIEAMKRRVMEMEEEAAKLTAMQSAVEDQLGDGTSVVKEEGGESNLVSGGSSAANASSPVTLEENSIYVGQVDYEASPEELQALFQSCGTINRVTIMCDRYTGAPKGFAYIEFENKDAVESALLLNDTTFRGRQLKVTVKRQNVQGYHRGRGRGRGRGGFRGRGRGRGRGGFRGRGYHPYY